MLSPSEETLFLQAIEIESQAARLEFLESACRDQPELLTSVKALLASYAKSEFLESTPQAVQALRTVNQSAAPMMLGPYRVIEQIARGGMGSVFLAEQTEPVQRRVAVKIIRPELDNEDIVRRFHLEQRGALALMDHKNIARVLDASTSESGISYFVMEYVDGLPIHLYCRQKQLSVQDRLKLFLDCAHAIQHAHQKGILHRDIKPSNVLVAEQDGKPLVKVIDFGIAKALQQDDGPNVLLQTMGTRLGEVLGTPQFMSPEQASLGTTSTDTRSDVYSLGALLYQLLTDVPPFDTQIQKSMPFDEVLRIIRKDDPIRPSQVSLQTTSPGTQSATLSTTKRPWMILKGDLDAIVMKAMEKDPARRYQNVGALIDDVERHLDSRPILARVPSTWYMLGKLAHRRRGLLISIIAASICLLTGTVAALIQAGRARQAEVEARVDEQRAIAAEHRAEELLYTAHLKLASSAMEKGDPAAALEALARQIPAEGKADLRSFDWYALARLNRPNARTVFRNEKSLYSMCLIVGTNRVAVVGADGIVKVINSADGSLVWQKDPGAGELNGVACSPDGKFLSVAGDDGRVFHLHADSGEIHSDFKPHDRQAFQVAWALDGSFFVTCGNEVDGQIWRFPGCELIRKIPTERDLECLAVSCRGDIALGCEGGSVVVADGTNCFTDDLKTKEHVSNSSHHCSAVTFSSDGELLASGNLNGVVTLYRKGLNGFQSVRSTNMSDAVGSLAFSQEQTSLLVGLKNGSVELVSLDEPAGAQFSLRISRHLHGKSGATLLSNQANGYDWGSLDIVQKPGELAVPDGPDQAQGKLLRVVSVTPDFVDGYLPKGTTRIKIEFSEPIQTDRLTDLLQPVRRPDHVTGVREKIVQPSFISVDGNEVTLGLSQQGATARQSRVLQKIHEGDVSAIRSASDSDKLFSVGSDGAVVEFRPASSQPFQIIAENTLSFGFGHSGITWVGEKSPQFSPWDRTTGLGTPLPLPVFDDWNTNKTVHAGNASKFAVYRVHRNDSRMECRLFDNPQDSSQELIFEPGAVNAEGQAIAISKSGQQIAVAFRPPATNANVRSTLLMKDLQTGETGKVDVANGGFSLQFSPEGRRLLLSDQNGLQLRQFPSGRLIEEREVSDLIYCVFSPDGREILTAIDDGMLRVLATEGLSEITSIRAHDISALHVDISPDGRTIATVGLDGFVKLWRRSGMELSAEIAFDRPLEDIEFSPDGTAAAVRTDDGTLYLIDARPSD